MKIHRWTLNTTTMAIHTSTGYHGIAHIGRNSSCDHKMVAVKNVKKKKNISNDIYVYISNVHATNRNSGKRNGDFVFTPVVRMCDCVRGPYSASLVTHRWEMIWFQRMRRTVVRSYTIHNFSDIEFSTTNKWLTTNTNSTNNENHVT